MLIFAQHVKILIALIFPTGLKHLTLKHRILLFFVKMAAACRLATEIFVLFQIGALIKFWTDEDYMDMQNSVS